MNRNIDLSNVPTAKFHGRYGKDWANAIGAECPFEYDGIKGNLTICGYSSHGGRIDVVYNGKTYHSSIGNIRNCNLRTIVGLRAKTYKVALGRAFKDCNRDITIIDRKMVTDQSGHRRKQYRYYCNICKWDNGWIDESHLLNGIGCACCSKAVIVKGINDLHTTNPELIRYFKDIKDTYKTTTRSKQRFIMVCPNCKNEQLYSTDQLSGYGFSCKQCGDGISYGEKFMYTLLKQIGIDFVIQLSHTTFKWCKRYKYDFYISKYNAIIEVHGRQHYDLTNRKELQNDIDKKGLAIENGITHYIVIDCRKSNLAYIKNSILDSGLLNLFNVHENDVDFNECDKFTSKSFITEICNYKNQHPELSTTDIAPIFGFARTTIQTYLDKGSQMGICIYDKDIERKCKNKKSRMRAYQTFSNQYYNTLCET